MAKFRKKPVEIEAFQWTGDTRELAEFTEGKTDRLIQVYGDTLTITTLEGEMTAHNGDWIIRGVQGELYPCKPDIFEATYEHIHDGQKADG